MTDVFLRTATSDGTLRDPTLPDPASVSGTADSGQGSITNDAAALLVFTGTGTTGEGSQTVDAVELEQFIASATTGQGTQTVSAVALLQFIAMATSAQGAQTVDAAELEQFIAAATAGQGTQGVDAVALLAFIGTHTAGQGSQTVDAAELEQFIATATTGQAAQSVDGTGSVQSDVVPARPIAEPGVLQLFGGPPPLDYALHIVIPAPLRPRRVGSAASAQSGGSAEGAGDVVLPARLAGEARTVQRSAEVIAIGTVDNRRPRNVRKAKLAALLLAA